MQLPVVDMGGGNSAQLEVPDAVFSRAYNAVLVHQAVVAADAGGRSGTRKQKSRAEVAHTKHKLFRQKGSGRARAGHSSTPLRRGGGRAFPASPFENLRHKMPRRVFRAAMAILLSHLAGEGRLCVVRSLSVDSKKTKDLQQKIFAMQLMGRILMIDTDWDDNLLMASQNLPTVHVKKLSRLLPTDLLAADVALFSERSINRCGEMWQ